PIDESLKRIQGSSNFQQRYEKMKREILNDPRVQEFISKHEDELTDSTIERNLMKLYEYKTQSVDCDKCECLDGCINMVKGYEPELVWRRGNIDIDYHRCRRKVLDDERKKNEQCIESIYVPRDILQATFSNIELDNRSRLEAAKAAKHFIDTYRPGEHTKGLYIYGSFGVGKSYLLGAIANELAERNVSSMLVYFPEFVREMKQSLSDHTLNEKLAAVKEAPVLMIDDIGAETMSSWVRDDILGTIVQYRMLEGLSTFFTSNFDYEGLEHHLTYSQRGEEEKLKAARIMERIRFLTIPVKVDGINRRKS
ncbi:MAG TPA: primosomal protein DnaI, partial [Chondromyces sp.]|nr:primosomal protein DnaI [Chondromyces sp.]